MLYAAILCAALATPGSGDTYGVIEVGGSIATGATVNDDQTLCLGTDCDSWLEYDTALTPDAVCLYMNDSDGGGTDGAAWCVNTGTDDVVFNGNITGANGETISNSSNGVWMLKGNGATNNEDLIFDFETTSNQILLTSTTGVTTISFAAGGFIAGAAYGFSAGSGLFREATARVAAAGAHTWLGRTELYSPADGQMTITNDAVTSGATLDVDDAAGTVVIKDLAGTGKGNLSVTGAQAESVKVITCADDPYTVLSTDRHIIVNDASGACTGNMDITLPTAACTPGTTACRVLNIVKIGASTQIDVGGFGGTETINGATTKSLTSQWESIDFLEINQASSDWIIQ